MNKCLQRRLSINDQFLFWSHLLQFSKATVPLSTALQWLKQSLILKHWQSRLEIVSETLSQGFSFPEALQRARLAEADIVAILTVAELTGDYTPFFQQIVTQLRWRQQMQKDLQHGLRYPLLLLAFLLILLTIVVVFLVPTLQQHLVIIGVKELPLITRIFITACKGSGYVLAVTMVTIPFLYALYKADYQKFSYVHQQLAKTALHLPLVAKYQMVHFFQNFGFLLNAKVNLLSALYHAAQTLTNPSLKFQIANLEAELIRGKSLSMAFASVKHCPKIAVEFIKLGEQTGNLSLILQEYTSFEMQQLHLKLKRLIEWLQPLLVILMGLVIIGVVTSILWPMYDMAADYAL